ncbi:MAG: M14 metallopeptidase family protein [bacterium]
MLRRQAMLVLLMILMLTACSSIVRSQSPQYEFEPTVDTIGFYPGGTYDPAITTPTQHLGRPIGSWPIHYWELVPYLEKVAEQSPRVQLVEQGVSHEGRRLYHLIITSTDNMARLEDTRQRLDYLADPRRSADKSVSDDKLPAVAWLGYSIHGDELSGVDAAVQLIYQLAAGTDEGTRHILDNTIVIIDPTQNPDGRERYLPMLEANRSAMPSYDHSAMQHQGVWPWGRTNHYLFDLNRDWVLVTQPETQGRLATILKWHPQLVVDGHEMGSDASFMSDPPREPINYNTPFTAPKWWPVFNSDHAAAFDERGWPYYTMEWHDQWYIGYGSAWATFSGSIGMLYEQARVDGEAIKQGDGYMLTYHEAVNHQFRSSWVNLTTLADNREAILADYFQARRDIVNQGHESGLKFLFAPDHDAQRMDRFITSLLLQGVEIQKATQSFEVRSAHDALGTEHAGRTFPAGTYIVNTAQPMGSLAKAALEFDSHLKPDFLTEERHWLEKYGDTRMYEVSAWSLPLAYDLDAYWSTSGFKVATEAVSLPLIRPRGELHNPEAQFGFVIDMAGEATNRLLAALFDEELRVYACNKAFTLEGRDYQRGALVLRKQNNPADLPARLKVLAATYGVDIYGVNTALSTEGSALGAGRFRRLTPSRVAIVTGDGMDYGSVGTLWFTLDQEVGVRHSLISLSDLHDHDLKKYNVIILPAGWGNSLDNTLGSAGAKRLQLWVDEGGTLICIDRSAAWAADSANGLSQVRLKRQVLNKLAEIDTKIARELAAEHVEVDTMALWHPEKVKLPPKSDEGEADSRKSDKPNEDADRWSLRFHPRGVIMRAEVDTTEWLSIGVGPDLPVMMYTSRALVSHRPVHTVARLATDPNKLRLSGLLWPEARRRWAGTSWATVESSGRGQVILFATDPNIRAYWWGTRQMFVNAVLYGPGFGADGEDY